ncbi:TPA: hypothetical protein ACONOZ_002667 [Staphylococcus aureus]
MSLFNDGEFKGYKKDEFDGVFKPVYGESTGGCLLGMLGTFGVFMILGAIMAFNGDSESAQRFKDIGSFLVILLRIIFIPIYLVLSIYAIVYVFSISDILTNIIYKNSKLETKGKKKWITIIIVMCIFIYLLYKLAKFIHLI